MRSVIKLVFMFGMFFLFLEQIHGQGSRRILENGPAYPNTPVEIVACWFNEKPVEDQGRLMGEHEWLKQLVFEVKNTSKKTIRSFDISLGIKQNGTFVLGFPVYFRTYTKVTDENALTSNGEKKIGPLMPGETVKVRMTDHIFSVFDAELKKRGMNDVQRATVEIWMVWFDDDSGWRMGQESPKQ